MPIFQETVRATVTPAECDYLDHMNIQYYFRAVSDGMIEMMARLGLTAEKIESRQIAFVAVEAQSEFHRELRAGDVIVLESSLVELGRKTATFNHRLRDAATEEIVMSTRLKCVFVHLGDRRATAIPDDIRRSAAKWLPEKSE